MQENIRFARCERCSLSMRVRIQAGNPDALLMRHSTTGEGLCTSCAATLFLYSVEHIKHLIERNMDMLLYPSMQQQFAQLMDAKPEEINWQTVKDNWNLPFAKQKTTRKKR